MRSVKILRRLHLQLLLSSPNLSSHSTFFSFFTTIFPLPFQYPQIQRAGLTLNLLTHIQEGPGSNLTTGYSDWGFLFVDFHCWHNAQLRLQLHPSQSFTIHHSSMTIIRRCVVKILTISQNEQANRIQVCLFLNEDMRFFYLLLTLIFVRFQPLFIFLYCHTLLKIEYPPCLKALFCNCQSWIKSPWISTLSAAWNSD